MISISRAAQTGDSVILSKEDEAELSQERGRVRLGSVWSSPWPLFCWGFCLLLFIVRIWCCGMLYKQASPLCLLGWLLIDPLFGSPQCSWRHRSWLHPRVAKLGRPSTLKSTRTVLYGPHCHYFPWVRNFEAPIIPGCRRSVPPFRLICWSYVCWITDSTNGDIYFDGEATQSW
jgi:hypothetical protein